MTLTTNTSEAHLGAVREELEGIVFRGVGGFLAKYFEDVEKPAAADADVPELAKLTRWVQSLKSLVGSASSVPGAVISLDDAAGHTRVFGEFYTADNKTGDSYNSNDTLWQFCARAKQVFAAQPTRRFLHGFQMQGHKTDKTDKTDKTLELWVFDRSGAYSSGSVDGGLLVRVLAHYARMSDKECGLDTFVGRDGCVTFASGGHSRRLHLLPKLIASPDYLVGLGTTCYAASMAEPEENAGSADCIVKFCWRDDDDESNTEAELLERVGERHVWGVVRLLGSEDLGSTDDLRRGLSFPGSSAFTNRTLSCVATAPLGRPIQSFSSPLELLSAMRDLVCALRSLYLDGHMLHRDICIRNLVLTTTTDTRDRPTAVLIDFDQALDLSAPGADGPQPLIGSDGFMAIGILTGQRHTYRHDLESLFYVFLWLAISDDHEHDDMDDILAEMSRTKKTIAARLRKWCSLDFGAVARVKAADMRPGPKGFASFLDAFSPTFAPLRGLAETLHGLLFPLRDGDIFTGTDTGLEAAIELYDGMEEAFDQSARGLT